MMRSSAVAVFAFSLLWPNPGRGQTANPTPVETTQDLIGRLNPAQRQQFDEAGKAFNAQHFDDALSKFKLLLIDVPGDPVLAKFSGEAALNLGDSAFALQTLKPIAETKPDDWQAAALLVRAYAESGDKANRDAAMAHMLDLHKRGVTPPQMQQYVVERAKTDNGSVLIFTSLVPWGHYQVYNYAQIFDSGNRIILRATIESNDADQPLFAKQHPDKASAGLRGFSLDGYKDTGLNNSNQKTETHFTFKFFEGQPSYNTVREEFINIASGKTKPISSRVNVLGQ